MNLLVLGRGKTGALVAEVATECGHSVRAVGGAENRHAAALDAPGLRAVDVVLDFTTPEAALENIRACAQAGTSMVVGTTGWYPELAAVRKLVEEAGIGLLYSSNFSIGAHIFFDIARAAASGLKQGYSARIVERHHAQKKDSPSGTAVILRKLLYEASGISGSEAEIEITSLREGDAASQHVILLDSPADTMMLVHDARSRRGFAEGAVLAAEWLQGKRGFYEFGAVLADRKK